MTDEQNEQHADQSSVEQSSDQQSTEPVTERLPWRWNRIKFASGNDSLAAAARRDLAAEAEHSHRRRIKGA
jgi:hypothetical protein